MCTLYLWVNCTPSVQTVFSNQATVHKSTDVLLSQPIPNYPSLYTQVRL